MNGMDRVRLQRAAGVREIVADIDALKLKYGFSRVKVLTPRAETNLRLGQKSLKPIRVQFEHSPSVTAVLCFTMQYPSSPLILESIQCTPPTDTLAAISSAQVELLQTTAEQSLRDFALSRAGAEEGYAVLFTEQFSQCLWPAEKVNKSAVRDEQSGSGSGSGSVALESVDDEMNTNDEEHLSDTEALSQLSNIGMPSLSIFRTDEQEKLDNDPLSSSLTRTPAPTPVPPPAPFKCRKCRCVLFTTAGLAPHMMMPQTGGGDKKKYSQSQSQSLEQVACPTLQLDFDSDEALWAKEQADASSRTSGGLSCPRCSCKLGIFDWAGSKCTCGQWIAPSFRITDSKVDRPQL